MKCLGLTLELHFKDLEYQVLRCSFLLSRKEEMKQGKRKVCGTCKFSKSEVPFGEYYCDNEESDCYQCECMYDDYCIDYKEE